MPRTPFLQILYSVLNENEKSTEGDGVGGGGEAALAQRCDLLSKHDVLLTFYTRLFGNFEDV